MLNVVINIVYLMLSLALLFAFIRLTRGPSLPDRVVALELIASIVVGVGCPPPGPWPTPTSRCRAAPFCVRRPCTPLTR